MDTLFILDRIAPIGIFVLFYCRLATRHSTHFQRIFQRPGLTPVDAWLRAIDQGRPQNDTTGFQSEYLMYAQICMQSTEIQMALHPFEIPSI